MFEELLEQRWMLGRDTREAHTQRDSAPLKTAAQHNPFPNVNDPAVTLQTAVDCTQESHTPTDSRRKLWIQLTAAMLRLCPGTCKPSAQRHILLLVRNPDGFIHLCLPKEKVPPWQRPCPAPALSVEQHFPFHKSHFAF